MMANFESTTMTGVGSRNIVKVLALLLIFGNVNGRSTGGPLRQRRMLMGVPVTIFNFPWSCWVNTDENRDGDVPFWPPPVGMCSIFTNRLVFVGVDNLRDIPASPERGLVVANVHTLNVFWGTDEPHDVYNSKVRHSKAEDLFISITPNVGEIGSDVLKGTYLTNQWWNTSIQWDVIGAVLNIAIIKIAGKIKWSPYVLPIPLPELGITEIKEQTEAMIRHLDLHPHSRDACAIASYGPVKPLEYIQVTYVPSELCRSIYCSKDPGYCFNFPYMWYHICFRTVVFTDPCKYDQGAALYCNWWSGSVFAILSQSDNCGIDGLPAVYTVMAAPLFIYAHSGEMQETLDQPLTVGRSPRKELLTLPPNVPTPTIFGSR